MPCVCHGCHTQRFWTYSELRCSLRGIATGLKGQVRRLSCVLWDRRGEEEIGRGLAVRPEAVRPQRKFLFPECISIARGVVWKANSLPHCDTSWNERHLSGKRSPDLAAALRLAPGHWSFFYRWSRVTAARCSKHTLRKHDSWFATRASFVVEAVQTNKQQTSKQINIINCNGHGSWLSF